MSSQRMPVRRPDGSRERRASSARGGLIWLAALMVAVIAGGCHREPELPPAAPGTSITPFNFQITESANGYQIEGFLAAGKEAGRRPAMLVLNGEEGNARPCIKSVADFATMGIRIV